MAAEPRFPFLDLATGARWTVTPQRPPAGLGEILKAIGLPWTGKGETVGSRLGRTRSFTRVWQPLCEAIMNTAPEEASARMFAWTMRRALLGGPAALVPWIFPVGLSAALVAPALATLGMFGAEIHFRRRLLKVAAERLDFDTGAVELGPDDRVILALPPWAIAQILPGHAPAMAVRPIVNAHFRLDQPVTLPGECHFLGLVNAAGHWLFSRGDVLSVTVSAAESLVERPPEDIAALLWDEAARAMGLAPVAVPPFRIMKEKRATLAHDPETVASRPKPATAIAKVILAGDWIASPWPCTIEAAVASGLKAAALALGRPRLGFGT